MYDFDWHENLGARTTTSAETIIDILQSFLDVDTVLDVGCGDGRWLAVCQARGARTICGVDGPWTDLTRLKIPADAVRIMDLSQPLDLQRRFSLAVSLEVAEHIEERFAGVVVDNLVRHSDVVLFGAAVPYQAGYRHVNEQWQSYWAMQFAARGYAAHDPVRGQIWNNDAVHFWYRQNALLYVNRANRDASDRVSRHIADNKIQQLPVDIVHPERYSAIASYRQIAFRPLMKEFGRQGFRKLTDMLTSRQ